MTTRKKKAWSHSEGNYGSRVRVFEAGAGGIIYGETRDRSLPCGTRTMSLRHRNKDEAVRWAKQQHAKLIAGEGFDRVPTLSRVLTLYLQNQTLTKCASEQSADHRRADMWNRVLGPAKDLSKLSMSEWQGFITSRRSGATNCHGLPVPAEKRKVVRDASIDGDLTFLNSVMNWASRWREDDRYLMSENPARGYPVPHEQNPRRPVATHERFERICAVAHLVRHGRGHGKKRRELPTYLPQILPIVWHGGRRISSVLSLMYEDLDLSAESDAPFGTIRFKAEFDKMGIESVVPMSPEARAAIDDVLAQRPGIGKAYLFPSLVNPGERLPTDTASAWLRAAEVLADVPKQEGSLFHAYRRGFVTARKGHSKTDVMELGGWKDHHTMERCYQRSDRRSMLKALTEPMRLTGLG